MSARRAPAPRPAPVPAAPPPPAVRRAAGWIDAVGAVLIAVHVAVFTLHTDRCARALDARVINAAPGLTAPRFFLDNDSYAWLAHARDLAESGAGRLRHTFMDNAPYGRPMHWSHPLLWGIRSLSALFMQINSWPLARALDLAGIWIMPSFQFVVFTGLFCAFRRKLGWGAAGLFVWLGLALEPLFSVFYPLKPDHHGLQVYAALLAFVCLYFGGLGWTSEAPPPVPAGRAFQALGLPGRAGARRWFAAAGLLGAISLWLGATVWTLAFAVATAVAATVLPPFAPAAGSGRRYAPELWRIWAGTGIAASAGFYLLEYAPQHLHMRLEVNHPVYWLTWLGVAESLIFVARAPAWRFWRGRAAHEWALVLPAALAAAAAPALILFGPADWHLLRDPVTYQWNDRFVAEFEPGLTFAVRKARDFIWPAFGLLPVAVGALLGRKSVRLPIPRAFGLYVLLFGLLFLRQLRWLPFFIVPLAAFAVLLVNQHLAAGKRSWLAPALAGALLLNAALADRSRWQIESSAALAIDTPEIWGRALAAKHTALRIGLAAGTNEWRMIGTTDDAPALYYFTGIPSVASFYWENVAGWQAEIEFYCDAPAGTRARELAAERGLTRALALPEPDRECLRAMRAAAAPDLPPASPALADRMAQTNAPPPVPWMWLDGELSAAVSERILLNTPAGYSHLQKPIAFYALSPAAPADEPAR